MIAEAEAAASQMPIVPAISGRSGTMPGTARNMPMIAVNTINATTRGLVSSRYWWAMGGIVARRVEAQVGECKGHYCEP